MGVWRMRDVAEEIVVVGVVGVGVGVGRGEHLHDAGVLKAGS